MHKLDSLKGNLGDFGKSEKMNVVVGTWTAERLSSICSLGYYLPKILLVLEEQTKKKRCHNLSLLRYTINRLASMDKKKQQRT